jgi:polyisoprenoid-binding protein YceI
MTFLFLLGLFSAPIDLNSTNTNVSFSVDSTWHLISGKAKEVNGKIWFDSPGDNSTSHVEVRIPVNGFDTESSSRDSRLREVMDEEHFPDIIFSGGPIGNDCKIDLIKEDENCSTVLPGVIQIRDVKQSIMLKTIITRKSGRLNFQAETALNWDTFNVEDPSILIAKLKKTVTILINVDLPKGS